MQKCTVLHANALPAKKNGVQMGITCAGRYLREMQNCMHNIPFASSD